MPSPTTFWNRPLIELQQELDSRTKGLTTAEAQQRLDEFGPNDFKNAPLRRCFLVCYHDSRIPWYCRTGGKLACNGNPLLGSGDPRLSGNGGINYA